MPSGNEVVVIPSGAGVGVGVAVGVVVGLVAEACDVGRAKINPRTKAGIIKISSSVLILKHLFDFVILPIYPLTLWLPFSA